MEAAAVAVKKKQLEAQLEAQLKAADKLFAAGDLRRAKMHADHYGVLGVAAPPGGRPTKESHDAVKAQHKALCDAFEAAADYPAAAAAFVDEPVAPEQKGHGVVADEEEEEDYYAGGRGRGGRR
ncbi:hypothetical protein VPH35_080799 [Triticum aestivum]